MITFFVSQFKPLDIKVTFAALIGKVGGSVPTKFYLLLSQRAKLVESFLGPVYELLWSESLSLNIE
jgi:hypothetical protein